VDMLGHEHPTQELKPATIPRGRKSIDNHITD
jgi:hypothetical protein